ncbi:MAG: Cof-type HAD-IIB family hydrolase [Bacilli bacterium]|nr:Cof-type HAD-IIB family hydrolase [Bacilli bacterium]
MYKLIAMDLDETLLNDQSQVCERNKKAIKKAQEKGIHIIPCSGRGPGFLGTLIEDLDLKREGAYSILANGAAIVNNIDNTLLHSTPLPYSSLAPLFAFGKANGLCIEVFTPTHVYFFNADDDEKQRVAHFGKNMIFSNDANSEIFKDKIILKMLFQRNDMPYLMKLAKALKPLTDGKIAISFSSGRYMELNQLGVNKGEGLKWLANYLDIAIEETIGIGDNLNDLQLLQTAGLGAAVANSHKDILSVADYICTSNNNEGGVGEVIEKFILK